MMSATIMGADVPSLDAATAGSGYILSPRWTCPRYRSGEIRSSIAPPGSFNVDIISYCPLRVASVLWRQLSADTGQESWQITLVVKATYALRPGVSPLAVEQEVPRETDELWNDDERKSLRSASDLAPFKDCPEVLVVGAAYAPRGRPVDHLRARVAVGELDKTIEVFGDRAFDSEGTITGFGPFARMPLIWERAAGGPGTSNPVGVHLDGRADVYGMVPLPNLRTPHARLLKRGDFIAPIGFAPMAPSWPLRAGNLGQYAAGWDHRRWSERPLPADFDGAYFNAAPLDQHQREPFAGNEQILLENLHPDIPSLTTRLQSVQPFAGVSRGGSAREDVPLLCDTLVIDADRAICTLIWRAQVSLWHPDDAGEIAVWMEQTPARARSLGSITLSGSEASPREAALPFAVETPTNSGIFDEPTAPIEPALPTRAPLMVLGRGVALVSPPPVVPPKSLVLLFDPPLPALLSQVTPPFESPPARIAVTTFPFDVPPPALLSTPDPAPAIEAPSDASGLPAPPPMLGPLAGLATRSPSTPASALEPEEPTVDVPAAAPPEPVAEVTITLEQLATITAEIVEARSSRAAILEAHGLTEGEWGTASDRWTGKLDRESARGGNKLRAPHDLAYLAAVERFRGPITLAEYARVVIAIERGGADPTLEKLAIQRPALMPLLRVWTKKVATDPRLADESHALFATLRERDDEAE